MMIRFLFSALLLLVSVWSRGQAISAHQGDSLILVALYQAASGSEWKNRDNWLSNQPLSSWYGVTLGRTGRVEALELKSNNLRGELPASLSQLDSLKKLNLSNNHLYGHIPEIHRIKGIGEMIPHDEEIFLYNDYTLKDIRENASAFTMYQADVLYFAYAYSGLRIQNWFGSEQYLRAEENQPFTIDLSFYRGSSEVHYRWLLNGQLFTETSEPVLALEHFDAGQHSGEWFCQPYFKDHPQRWQRFSLIYVQGMTNGRPGVQWQRDGFSEQDRLLPATQIREAGQAFSNMELRPTDDFPVHRLKFRIRQYPKNIQIRIGCGTLQSSEANRDLFVPVELTNDVFSGCTFYSILCRRNDEQWIGRDSLVIEVCDDDGACITQTSYFVSQEGFAPAAPDPDRFGFRLGSDGILTLHWDSIAGADRLIFHMEHDYNEQGCLPGPVVGADHGETAAESGYFSFDYRFQLDKPGVQNVHLKIQAANQYGTSAPAVLSFRIPQAATDYGFSYSFADDKTIKLSIDAYTPECAGGLRLYQKTGEQGDFEMIATVWVNTFLYHRLVDAVPGQHYSFYIGPGLLRPDRVLQVTSDTLHVYVPDKAPVVKASLQWLFQKRLRKYKSTLVSDDKDAILSWSFRSRAFEVEENGDTLLLQLKERDWLGRDTLFFSVGDSGGNRLDTFALVEATDFNTPPRMSVQPGAFLRFPIKSGTKHLLDLKWFVADQETARENMVFRVRNTGLAQTSLSGQLLDIYMPNIDATDTTEFWVIAIDEADARDSMLVKILYSPRENNAPRILGVDTIRQEYGRLRTLSNPYPPLALRNHASDDSPLETLTWSIKPHSYYVNLIPAMIDLIIENDTFYIKPKPEANFNLLNPDINKPAGANDFSFYIHVEDIDGAKDSLLVSIALGNEAPELKEFPYTDLYPGDTIRFNPFDYLVFAPQINKEKVSFKVLNHAGFATTIDEYNQITVTHGDFVYSGSKQQDIMFFMRYGGSEIGYTIPLMVHDRSNKPPVLKNIPVQYLSAEGFFAPVDLKNYVSDDHTPTDQLFWYVRDNELVDIAIRNGILYPDLVEESVLRTDTVRLVVEDFNYKRDSIEVVFVREENSPPQILPIPEQIIYTGGIVDGIWLDEYISDDHTPVSELIRSVTNLSGQLEISLQTTYLSVVLRDENWQGTDSVLCIVEDAGGLSASVWIRYSVSPVAGTISHQVCRLSVAPNPTDGVLRIRPCTERFGDRFRIRILQADGSAVYTTMYSGQHDEVLLELRQFAAGLYYLMLDEPESGYNQTEKIIIAR